MLTRGQQCAAETCQKPEDDVDYNECTKCTQAFHLTCTTETAVITDYICLACKDAQDSTNTQSTHFSPESSSLPTALTPTSPPLTQPAHQTHGTSSNTLPSAPLPLSPSHQTYALPPSYPTLLPDFSGRLHEDPARFIAACEDTLRHQQLPEQLWLHNVKGQLKGEAAQWWNDYGEFVTDWPQLKKRLQTRFASPAKIGLAQREFYGTEQRNNEPAEKFLRQKTRLEQRLNTRLTEEELVGLLITQLNPELRSLVRAARPRDLEDLIDRAIEIEADLQAPRKTKANYFSAPPKAAITPAPSPPKCQHCPQWHLHRHCPVLQQRLQGNYHAKGTSAPPPPVQK